MSAEIRNFLPGACATGPAEPVFAELDRGVQTNRLVVLAQDACHSCIQLPDCNRQRKVIAEELGARGVDRTVIGAVALEIPKPPDEKRLPEDTCFTFNLQYPLSDSHHTLRIIQQGFRSHQLRLPGAMPTHFRSLAAYLEDHLLASGGETRLKDLDQLQQVARAVSWIMLRYRPVHLGHLSRRKRLGPLSDEEKLFATELQEAFIEDVSTLQDEGFGQSVRLAQVHAPAFYKRVMEIYASSYHITPGRIRSIIKNNAINPIPPIEKFIEQQRLQKQPATPRPVKSTRQKQVDTETPVLDLRSVAGFKRRAPELRNYINVIASRSDNPREEARQLYDRHRNLRAQHPDITLTALAYISNRYVEGAGDIIERYRGVLADLQGQHGGNHDVITQSQLERFAYTYLEKAPKVVDHYLENFNVLRDRCASEGFVPSNYFLRWHAEEDMSILDWDEVRPAYEKHRLRFETKKWRSLDGWMLEKAVLLHDPAEVEKVLSSLKIFLRRRYLVVAYADRADETTATTYNIVDPAKGSYLRLSEEFSHFPQEEQKAILASFGLDRMVLGYDVDTEELRNSLGTANLDQFVDEHLLPYTRQVAIDPNDPADILDFLRAARRDTSNNARKESAGAIVEALASLLAQLQTEAGQYYSPSDSGCNDGMRNLLLNAQTSLPRLLKNPQLLKQVAIAYLEDAHQIKNLGCSSSYNIALGYSGTFCSNLFASIGDEAWQPRPHALTEMLRRSTGQVVPHVRRYQQLVREFMPAFKNRKIGISYLRECCIRDPEGVGARIAQYDKVVQTFKLQGMAHAIHHYCFHTEAIDPIEEIRGWRRAVAGVSLKHRDLLGTAFIKKLALSKRGDALTQALDDRIELLEKLLDFYRRSPHPAVDDDTVKFFAQQEGNARKHIKAHLKRWEVIHAAVDIADEVANIDIEVLRKLTAIQRNNPVEGIKAYISLRNYFRNDMHIVPSLIDKTIRWSLNEANASLHRQRRVLRNFDLSLNRSANTRDGDGGSSQQRVDFVVDPDAPAPDTGVMSSFIDPEEPTREQSQLLTLFSTLSTKERAAIAIVHQIPWALPQAMQDDDWTDPARVCGAFNVQHVGELKPIVGTILAQLRNPRA